MANFNQRKLDEPVSSIDLSKGDFDCDSDVDGKDQIKFLQDFVKTIKQSLSCL